jgi:hypothetical protein
MWRAYGGATGVAIVLSPTPFLVESQALRAYTSPVGYFTPTEFRQFRRCGQPDCRRADFPSRGRPGYSSEQLV